MKITKKNAYTLSLGVPFFGLICIGFYSSTAHVFGHVAHAFGLFVLTAGATFLLGALLGFLFAIPKSSEVKMDDGKQVYRANTNLEQISDWLTKILLGVGLTQMDEIGNKINSISQSMAGEMNLLGHEAMFISSLIVFYTVCGFLNGYLFTRIVLPGVFAKTDAGTTQDSEIETNPQENDSSKGLENR
jgi:hypothetical protein